MPNDVPHRGVLTDALIDHLKAQDGFGSRGILVGDAGVPGEAGWTGTQPGQGQFIASVKVDTGEGTQNQRDTVRSRHTSWQMTYSLKSTGAARQQADHTADLSRDAALSFIGFEAQMGLHAWKVVDVVYMRFGGVIKVDPTDAPTYEVTDTVSIWLERTRA